MAGRIKGGLQTGTNRINLCAGQRCIVIVGGKTMRSQSDLLLSLAEGTSRQVGRQFLDSLSVSLRDAMDVSVAMLTERVGEDRARTVVATDKDGAMQDFEYKLDGTPCELVYHGDCVVVEDHLPDQFDTKLENVASYVGVPLRAVGEDRVIGHLSVLSANPLQEKDLAETVLRIYGQRAEAELHRIAIEREREDLLEDLKGLNRRLSENYERAHKANEYKTQVLGMVAHDLRNPVGQVLGFADLISMTLDGKDHVEAGQVKEDLDQIVSVGRTMLEQVQRILDSAKEEANELPMNARAVDLRDTVKTAIRVNRDAAARKGISVIYQGQDSVPASVDEGLIQEALDNLISNAIKYSHSNTTVTVSAIADGASATLSVCDEGQGLDDDDLQKAFGRFQRLSATPTAGEDSAGLGLYNVKAIAERHGGKAWGTSPGKGKGATFCVEVPV